MELFAGLEAQPGVKREALLCRCVEVWLNEQRAP